jgi:hypothetical protein
MSKRGLSRSASVLALAMVLSLLGGQAAFAAPPSNDNFNGATVISSLPFGDSLDTTEATRANNDPDCSGGDGHTVWYVFTPSADTDVTANTFGSDYDTTLSAYTGPRNSLNQVACNDDSGSTQSLILFRALAGTPYHLMVASFDDTDGGNMVLSVAAAPPPVRLRIFIAPNGSVTGAGVATIHGRLTCSRAVSPVDLLGSLRQQRRGGVTLGYFDGPVNCPGTTAWSATVVGETGFYGPGDAKATVAAAFIDPIRQEPARASAARTVHLSR